MLTPFTIVSIVFIIEKIHDWPWCILFFSIKVFFFNFRLTPCYAVILMFYTCLLPNLLDGPYWKFDFSETCHHRWWTNLLYINNIYKLKHGVILLFYFCNQYWCFIVIHVWPAQLAWAVEYTDSNSAEGSNFPSKCPGYDAKQSDDEAPIVLEYPFCHRSQVHSDLVWLDRVLSMGQTAYLFLTNWLVGWLFCFTAYQSFSGHLLPN